jgi:hypothetical protein
MLNAGIESLVMPGLVPGIHVLLSSGFKDVDGRDKPGHDIGGKQNAPAFGRGVCISAVRS